MPEKKMNYFCNGNTCAKQTRRDKFNDIPIPKIGDHDVLIRVKAAAVNPVDILNLTGAVRLIQDYRMPLTLGNECAGIMEKAGKYVTRFIAGDRVYSRVPVSTLGAFAEYVVIHENAVAHMPAGLDFAVAAAIPLTGLTAYQAITEELHAKPGETLFIQKLPVWLKRRTSFHRLIRGYLILCKLTTQ